MDMPFVRRVSVQGTRSVLDQSRIPTRRPALTRKEFVIPALLVWRSRCIQPCTLPFLWNARSVNTGAVKRLWARIWRDMKPVALTDMEPKRRGKTIPSSDGSDTMELYTWGPAFGMPSVDAQTIHALAYIRFSSAPVNIIECNNPWKSKKSTLPFFKHGNKFLFSADDICVYLRQKNHTCDYGLTSKQGAEIVAFGKLMEDSLYPAAQFYSFIQEKNYMEIIRPAYGTLLPWLYKMWYTDRYLKENAHILIKAIYREAEFEPERFEGEVLVKAQHCIKILSDKLGDRDYFLANSPTTLDAIAYSYLVYFNKVNFLHCPLKEVIKGTPNLERYIARISLRYFTPKTDAYGAGGDTNKKSAATVETDPSGMTYPLSHKLFGFFVAGSAMLFYAYKNGMLNFRNNVRIPVEEVYWE